MRNATISEATGRRTHNAEHRIINTHHERLTYDEYFQVSPRRVVSQHKGTDLICVPATFGISAMLDPQCRERRLVTMNTTSGCSMHKCLKASTSTRHTTQHKPQFGRARGGLPIQWLRLITSRNSTSKFPGEAHTICTAKIWGNVHWRCRLLVDIMQSCSRTASDRVHCRSRDTSDP